MAILSMQSRKRTVEVALTATLCISAFLVQTLILNRLHLGSVICNLPLVITIVWGLVFGSPLPRISNLELRKSSLGQIFTRQLLAGSPSALMIGLLFASLYKELIPSYPIAFPVIGWIAGYVCLRALSQGNLLCIPLTFVLTAAAEALTSWELVLLRREGVFDHLSAIVLPEAMLNALIAPFIYLPLRQWYEITEGQRNTSVAME
jgi:cell shape-determining protein MreD